MPIEPGPDGFVDVTVVMPAYNNAATIGRALASVAAQTLPPREVIVVDDGSADGTAQAALAMIPVMNGVRLRLFRQANNGAGAARNQAIAAAACQWLAFLDADDEWVADKLKRQMAALDPARVDMIGHNVVVIDQGGERVVDCHARWKATAADPFAGLFLRGFISSSTIVLRTEVARRVGGFDSTLRSAQDYELWLAVLAAIGDRLMLMDAALLRYYVAADGITSNVERKVACSLAILRRHMGVLKARGGAVLGPVLLRLAAIHLEAVRACRGQGRWGLAAKILLLMPVVAMAVLAAVPRARYGRPDFLSRLPAAQDLTP